MKIPRFQEMESRMSTKVLQVYSQCDDKVCAWENFISEQSRFPNRRYKKAQSFETHTNDDIWQRTATVMEHQYS